MHTNKKHPLTITFILLFTILLLCICIVVIYPKTQTPPMESFAKYLEELCREGHRSQLDQCVISRRLSLEEAAALADSSPLLEHMAGYAEHMPNINTVGICVLTADVDGDGLEDVIEYGPAEDSDGANMLAIYLQEKEGGYRLSYSQPVFDTRIHWTHIIEVVKYQKNTYLLFIPRYNQSRITAYRLSAGIPQEKMEFTYVCSNVKAETIFCSEGYDVERVLLCSADFYHTADYYHCAYADRRWKPKERGSGEMEVAKEEWEEIRELFNKKYREEQRPYIEKYGDTLLKFLGWGFTDVFESDMNNNGVRERYIKKLENLFFYEEGIPAMGLSIGLPFMTGEYYGSHEGRMGLWYCIEESGEEMDFQSMCGLDIWEGEMTPKFFWVDETERGNITCIIFQDGEAFEQRVDGYYIQDGTYEQVFSVSYTPEISCQATYDCLEDEGVGYIVYLTKDKTGMELMWKDGEKAEPVNSHIREMLKKKAVDADLQEGSISAVQYWPAYASEEVFVAECVIFYDNYWEEGHTLPFYISIDLMTGECRELSYEEWIDK